MNDQENSPLDLAMAVLDGKPIDWDSECADSPGKEIARQLRVIDQIRRTFNSEPSGATQRPDPELISTYGDSAMDTAPDSWGPLRILEAIGRGGSAEVYRAFDPSLQIEVALKLPHPETLEKMGMSEAMTEARKLASIRHPNVLRVLGVAEHEGRPGLWTEMLHGKNLFELIREQGPMNAHEASQIGLDLCRALAAVHATGLVYRDLKAHNVLREQGGRIVLLDLGIATSKGAGVGGVVAGTPLYMAPEQLRGGNPDPSWDVYGLGVLLYHLVTGKYPVQARGLLELSKKHEKGEILHLREARPDLPGEFVALVHRALDADPQKRFSGMGEFEDALVAWRGGTSGLVQQSAGRSVSRYLAWAGVVALVTLAAVFAWPVLFPSAYRAEVDLYRLGEGTEERLVAGATTAPGDRLFMEFEGNRDLYVYVLNEDENGEVFVLFPLPGFDLSNPLKKGERHRLPGELGGGNQKYWQVTSAGGAETFLVLASPSPLTDVEQAMMQMPKALPGRAVVYKRLSGEALKGIRGIGGVVGKDAEVSEGQFADVLKDVTPDDEEGVWIRKITVDNPRQ